MEKTERAVMGTALLLVFLGLLGWNFWATYIVNRPPPQVQEKMLTVHDELFAIDGRHNGTMSAVGKFGLMISTQDGGKTWKEQSIGKTNDLLAVSFADDQHGFVVGSGGTILATADASHSWQAQNSGTRDQLLGVYAVSPTEVYAVGAFGTVLSTSDGGHTWVRHKLSWESLIERVIKASGYMEPNLNSVYFISPEIGWVVGEFGVILHTRDAGQNWISQRYGGELPQLYAVKFLDDRRGWAIGQRGTMVQTNDGGQRWLPVELGMNRDLFSLSLAGEQGVIVGDGVVFTSHSRGSTWVRMESIPEVTWLSGVSLKSEEAVAVGRAGTIMLLNLDKTPSDKNAG
jgi:photosystem II stability/assembly factor-like uncharacterized protein